MTIRRADEKDIPQIDALLYDVLKVHHAIRPDIFKPNAKKYSDEELKAKLNRFNERIFVAVEGEKVLGYAFCVLKNSKGSEILRDIKTLYIDDLCVKESERGKRVGSELLNHVYAHAKSCGCYNVALNVWAGNKAFDFYEKNGFAPQKTTMEKIIK